MGTSVAGVLTRAADSAARRHVGIVLGLVDARSGETVVAGRGSAERPDGRPVSESTLFEIGSVTKTFTALLLADAVVRDEVQLDTPLHAIVPTGVRVPSRDGVDITLEDLATHRSGLPHSPLGWAPVLRSPLAGALVLTQHERHRSRLAGGMALAWMRWSGPSGPLLFHGGATGGFRTFTAFAPDAALGVVALSNSTRAPDRAAIGLLRDLTRAGSTRSGSLPDPPGGLVRD